MKVSETRIHKHRKQLVDITRVYELGDKYSDEKALAWLAAYLPEGVLAGFIEDINGFHARNANDPAACCSVIEYQDDLKRRER